MTKKIIVVSDVDGCLTDGGLYYTATGKAMKKFGAGDHEGLKLLKKNGIDTEFISADRAGLPIVEKRMKDMSNSKLTILSETERVQYIMSLKEKYDIVVFFGDGLGDASLAKKAICDVFICPKQARSEVKLVANYVTEFEGGYGAYLDMAIWICKLLKKDEYKSLY